MIGHIYAMARTALFLLMIALLFSHTVPAEDRILAAEGDYAQETTGSKAVAHWKLWHLRNGGYEVVETIAHPHVVQIFSFDGQFLPSGFSLTIDPAFGVPAARRAPVPLYPTIISCQYNAQNLTCSIESNGKKSAITVPANQPYVLVPGEFYLLDYTWLMTGVLRLIEHSGSSDSAVNVFVIANDRIHRDSPIKLKYAGEVTAQVMGKAQPVKEYEGQVGGEYEVWGPGVSVVQVNSQDLVLSVREKLNPRVAFAVINYKEYESWQPGR